VTEDLWAESNTTPDAIDAALRELLRERHAADETLAPARVLNMVVVVDREWKGEIANRLQRVGRYHPSRTVLCAVEDRRETLDARAVMSYEESKNGGGLGVIREVVEIDMGPEHLSYLGTIVDPILVSELPTVLWSPHGHEEAVASVLYMIDVVLLDSDDLLDPPEAFRRANELLRSAYVVDLAWLRTTPWRERLAASFDPPSRCAALARGAGTAPRHRTSSRASAMLLAGWLASRLRWETGPLSSLNGAGLEGAASGPNGPVGVKLEGADQDTPGLAGVTISCQNGFALALDRGPGGLRAREQSSGGIERSWRVLGASRGEGGILGEGIRQALLRDPTYGPALDAALRFCG
jgi:glucose-6-phosphate dehydrogenase assembly protein OpcA